MYIYIYKWENCGMLVHTLWKSNAHFSWACIQMGHGQTHGECCKKACLRLPEARMEWTTPQVD